MDDKEKLKLHKAFITKDPRYDGRIYIGVKTTGIYCRPICPAQPKIQNINFYRSKAEAEKEGYRPCLRCRPDLSPLSPQWQGSQAIIGRALECIKTQPQDIKKLAAKVGMSDRHLRRIFQEHVGASPMEIALSYRLHLSRQLLSQSNMKIVDVAMASGFKSLRRFNDAFVKTYKKNPSYFRTESKKVDGVEPNTLKLEIPVSLPYDFNYLLSVYRNHYIYGVENIGEEFYERHFCHQNQRIWFKVTFNSKKSCICIETELENTVHIRFVLEKVKKAFDLSHNPNHIEFTKNTLKSIRHDISTVRVAGYFDDYEGIVCIILGQLVSTEQGMRNIKKLVEMFGQKINSGNKNLNYFFPTPEILVKAPLEKIGITKMRAEAIRLVSAQIIKGQLDFQNLQDFTEVRRSLLAIKGIGPWTVEMIALRCLRDPDAFPAGDLIIKRALEQSGLNNSDFTPWRAYLCMALWKNYATVLTNKRSSK